MRDGVIVLFACLVIFTTGLFAGDSIGSSRTVKKFEETCTSKIPLVKRMEGYSLEMTCEVRK